VALGEGQADATAADNAKVHDRGPLPSVTPGEGSAIQPISAGNSHSRCVQSYAVRAGGQTGPASTPLVRNARVQVLPRNGIRTTPDSTGAALALDRYPLGVARLPSFAQRAVAPTITQRDDEMLDPKRLSFVSVRHFVTTPRGPSEYWEQREPLPFPTVVERGTLEAASWALPRLHQLHLSGSLFGEPLFDYPQQRP
jgi:hypothetical protein